MVEGTPLLRAQTRKGLEGSNPFVSATTHRYAKTFHLGQASRKWSGGKAFLILRTRLCLLAWPALSWGKLRRTFRKVAGLSPNLAQVLATVVSGDVR